MMMLVAVMVMVMMAMRGCGGDSGADEGGGNSGGLDHSNCDGGTSPLQMGPSPFLNQPQS